MGEVRVGIAKDANREGNHEVAELVPLGGWAELGPVMLEHLGVAPGDTVILSARKVEKLTIPIEFPDGSKHCPYCGGALWTSRYGPFAGVRTDNPNPHGTKCECLGCKFHFDITLKLADLLAGHETEVEA